MLLRPIVSSCLFRTSFSISLFILIAMSTQTISISRKAYDALLREKRSDECLSETILRLIKTSLSADSILKKKVLQKDNQSDFSNDWYTSQDLI